MQFRCDSRPEVHSHTSKDVIGLVVLKRRRARQGGQAVATNPNTITQYQPSEPYTCAVS